RESIRLMVVAMTAEEMKLLQERKELQRKDADGTNGFALLVSSFGLVLFGVLYFLFVRANQQRRQAEAALKDSNFELERRVEERTVELAWSLEKVAWLASFPEESANPVIEIDCAAGVIDYLNPNAVELWPDLKTLGLNHPWLAGLDEAMGSLPQDEKTRVVR